MGKTVVAIVGVVAAVAIAVVAPYLAPLALGALGITATATAVAVATAVIGLALSAALAVGMRFLAGGAPVQKSPVGPPTVFRQSISDAFIVYGKRRVGGLMVFFHPRVSGSDHFRYFVIAVAGHRCQGIVSWQLGDETVTVDGSNMVTSGKYANAAWLWFQRGLDSETANATFVSECGGKWTTDHKGNGTAAIYAKFKMTDAVVQAGMPNITAVIEGKDDILDPRDASTGYTRNGPLIFYDWMKLPREEGGFGAYDDEIPDDTFISAQANVADEVVNSEPRYALDAFIVTGSTPSEIRDVMVVNMAGTYTYSGGKHLMRPGYWVPVSVTLSEDDLAGPIQVSPFMASDRAANEVSGTYVNPADGYQAAAFATKSVAADDIRQLSVDFAYTTSKYQAERMANIMLERAQREKTVVWTMNIMGLGVTALDTVQCDSGRYGLSNYAFQVGQWGLSADWGVVLGLREESEEIYGDPAPVSPSAAPTLDVAIPLLSGEYMDDLPAVTIVGDYTGMLASGQFPMEIAVKRLQGTTNVSASSEWTAITESGDIDYTIGAATGVLTVTDIAADSVIVISSERNGQTLRKKQAFNIILSDPPNTGGSGTTSWSDTTLSAVSSTSMTTISDELVVTVGPSGIVNLTAPTSARATPNSTSAAASPIEIYLVWQWWDGAAWVNLGTEAASNPDYSAALDPESGTYRTTSAATLSMPGSKTGLVPAASEKFRLQGRTSVAGISMAFTGTATATTS